MIHIRKAHESDLDKICRFIANTNKRKENHVGYCGQDFDEIKQSLQEDFDEVPFHESFVLATIEDKIIGVLGMDIDVVERQAEVWGPFVKFDEWHTVAEMMWKKMIDLENKNVDKASFFINSKNEDAQTFVKSLSCKNLGHHNILSISKECLDPTVETLCITELRYEDRYEVIALHDSFFPDSYLDGNQIVERVDENNKVFVSKDHEIVQGYIFVEVQPDFNEGSIEFFAVKKDHRHKGIGKSLLHYALTWMFSCNGISQIQLCVSLKSKGALALYQSIGFTTEDELQHYGKKLRLKE